MKKIALSILSLFILLGGIFVTACDKKVSLSIAPQYEEIEIYTNNKGAAGNYQEKMVIVDLKNSNDGIGVDVLTGQGSVHILEEEPVSRGNGQYSFTIVADESGEAKVKVYAIEDFSQSVEISVYVKTMLEKIVLNADDDFEGTSRFAVRGQTKKLQSEDYFNLLPLSANVKDLIWEFADESLTDKKTLVVGGVENAWIEDGNVLRLSESATVSTIKLKALFKNDTSIFRTVDLEVLNNATIDSLKLFYGADNFILYEGGKTRVESPEVSQELKRNDSSLSRMTGNVVVNSQYSVELLPEVYSYTTNRFGEVVLSEYPLSESEFQKYFTFNILSKVVDAESNKTTYEFEIDSRDVEGGEKLFGNFCFFFNIKYDGYKYKISTKTDNARLYLNIEYTAQKIELLNSDMSNLNNTTLDIFSSYSSGNGYKISPLIYPNDVAIDNNTFKIQIENVGSGLLEDYDSVSKFLKIYHLGRLVEFVPVATGSSTWVSKNPIESNSALYFASAEDVDILEGVKVDFISVANPISVKTSIYLNLYKISNESELTIKEAKYNDIDLVWEAAELEDRTFISSSIASPRKLTYTIMVEGISTSSGLSLKTEKNSRFDFSDIKLVASDKDATGKNFVVITFDVELIGYNFASEVNFWLEHITGKKSDEYVVEAFVPLTNATIQSADNSNTSIYINESLSQSFVKDGGYVVESGELAHTSSSLSKIVLEAGVSLPIDINFNNATLRDEGMRFSYFALSEYAKTYYDGPDVALAEDAWLKAVEDFSSFDADKLSIIATTHQGKFSEGGLTGLFDISNGSLVVTDNAFQGFVCVEFDGYDEEHQEATIYRFFAIESLYSVRTLNSNIETKELFTSETLSFVDMSRSYVDVVVALRFDEKIPTYSNDLSLFDITSELMGEEAWKVSAGGTRLENDYYVISNLSFGNEGRYLKFRITANSTQLQTKVNDTISIAYEDKNGINRNTAIEISIKNAKRVEQVDWTNRTGEQKDLADGEIYLNLTTTVEREKSFTVSTSVYP
ncbi:MAG: hypothetical protein J6J24_01370, partial [Clostridia bacterium]|nr:hypothetical protein [Clostridia bacterium]